MRVRSRVPQLVASSGKTVVVLACWTAFVAPPLPAEDPAREEVAFEEAVDLAAQVHTGGPLAGRGPVRIRLRDTPLGNPDAKTGVPRSHEQGERGDRGGRGETQPGHRSGMAPETEPDAVEGSSPEPEPDFSIAPHAPSAVGTVLRTFEGQGYTGWIPPDPVLAVGPRYIVEVVNAGFTIFSKDGGLDRPYTDLVDFFEPLFDDLPEPWSNNAFVFDPRAIYSPEHDKFVIFGLGRDDNRQRSYLFLGISETTNPLGDWDLYFYYDPHNLDSWIDYAGMSADEYGLYMTGNELQWGAGFKHAIIVSIRPGIFHNGSSAGWIHYDLRWNSAGSPFARTLQPAVPKTTPFDDETFFVNTYTTEGDEASLWELRGDRGDEPTLVRHTVDVAPYEDPGQAAQPSGADDLDMFSSGTLGAAYSQRKVYFSLNDAGTDRSGFYVGKLDVDDWVQERNITYYSNNTYYFYPAVGLFGLDNANPLVAVSMSFSSNEDYPSGAAKIFENYLTDATGFFQITGGGSAAYHVYDPGGRNRWGDYLGIARDWTCNTIWFLTQYAPEHNTYSTRLKHVQGDAGLSGTCQLIFDDGFERGSTANW